MKIEYLGHSCFLLQAKSGARFLTDPYDGIGYPMPRADAECVLCTHGHFDHHNLAGVRGVREVIEKSGSYERGGVSICAVDCFHDDVRGAKRGKNVVFILKKAEFASVTWATSANCPAATSSRPSAGWMYCSYPSGAPTPSMPRARSLGRKRCARSSPFPCIIAVKTVPSTSRLCARSYRRRGGALRLLAFRLFRCVEVPAWAGKVVIPQRAKHV